MNDPQPEGHMSSHIERRKILSHVRGRSGVAARGAGAATSKTMNAGVLESRGQYVLAQPPIKQRTVHNIS
jgi:hypothetical protein